MKILTEKEAEDFLEKEGFPIVKRKLAKNLQQVKTYAKQIGYPVALKNPLVLHKTEKNAVKIDLTEDKIEQAYAELKSKEVLVQKFVKGNEILIGLKKDPAFGHVIVFGLGGIFTEILKDVTFRVCPISKKDADEMIKEIKAYPILKGIRGQKPINIDIIKDVMLKICKVAKKYQNIKELDINPMIINEKQSQIVDARIIFE